MTLAHCDIWRFADRCTSAPSWAPRTVPLPKGPAMKSGKATRVFLLTWIFSATTVLPAGGVSSRKKTELPPGMGTGDAPLWR